MSKLLQKQRTTIYLSPEVLRFLKIRGAHGEGSVSKQLEDLAKSLMPKTEEALKKLEQEHARGYTKNPDGEFNDFYSKQDLEIV